MSSYQDGTGTGGNSEAGKTTQIGLSEGIDPKDEAHLCAIVCSCDKSAPTGAAGQTLKQMCVSRKLTQEDKALNYQSPYKAEVNYDMSKDPPAPITASAVATQPHSYIPAWIRKYWVGQYVAGRGNIRRPDVVVVNDPTASPTQDNIKTVVEIKFEGDTFGANQQRDYETIAGDPDKFYVMTPQKCGCSKQKPEAQTQSALSKIGEALNEESEMFKKAIRNARSAPFGGMPPLIPAY